MELATVDFDDETRVPPEEVHLDPAIADVESDIDFGTRQTGISTQAEKSPLQLTTSPLGRRIELFEDKTKSGYSATAPAAANQLTHRGEIENPKHLCLGYDLPQLPLREHSGDVEQGALHGRAGNSSPSRPIGRRNAIVPMSGNTLGGATPSIRRRNIERTVVVLSQPPQSSGRPVRKDCALTASEDSSHPPRLHRERQVPNCIDTSMHPVQTSNRDATTNCPLGHSQPFELLNAHNAMLANRKLGDAMIRNPRSMGRLRSHIDRNRPIGGGLCGLAAHAPKGEARSRTRGASSSPRLWRNRDVAHAPQAHTCERPGVRRASRKTALAC